MRNTQIILLLSLLVPAPLWAQNITAHIDVSGEAITDIAPDSATIRLAIMSEALTAEAASAEAAKASAAVISALKSNGLTETDLHTVQFNVWPVMQDETDVSHRVIHSTIKSYRATHMLGVFVKDVKQVGALIGVALKAGATSIDDISFSASNTQTETDRLRTLAVENARHRAEIYATAAHMKLGKVIAILPDSETTFARPPRMMAMAVPLAQPALPVEPGLEHLASTVKISWELLPKE
eukprot:gene15489-15633_t